MKFLLGTRNKGKLREIKDILGKEIEVYTPLDLSLNLDIIEDGETLKDNAEKKAEAFREVSGFCSFGEDTGLFVNYLDGAPGIYSARYSGEGENENRARLLRQMEGVEDRRAEFRTVVVLSLKNGESKSFKGKLEGRIAYREMGSGGFGYDSIFIPAGYDVTLAAMPEELKNKISHRKKAFEEFLEFFKGNKKYLLKHCNNSGV